MSSLKGISEEYLWCRDVQHSWDPYTATITRSKASRRTEVHQVLICTRCTTLKTRVMTPNGEILRSSYSYPNGYLVKDQGPLTPADRAMIRTLNVNSAKSRGDV